MSSSTLILGVDPTDNIQAIKCSIDGNLFAEIGPTSSIAIVDPNNDNTLAINNDGSINVLDNTVNNTLNTINNNIVEKTGDIISNILLSQGAPVYADTTPIPFANSNPLNNKGWVYSNTSSSNAMNLYYFDGLNETKELNQLVGQYAVITNFTSILSNHLIFVVYTQGTLNGWYESRITRSSSNNKLIGGGKYLIYWGSVPSDIYPNLPRIEMDITTTTGPALPTELILSTTLNTNSSAPTGQATYLIESLGAVIGDSSRVLNLLIESDYELNQDISNTLGNLNNKINNNSTYPTAIDVVVLSGGGGGGGGLVQIQGFQGTGWANLTATSGKLNVNDTATTSIDGKIFNATTGDTQAIKVAVVSGGSSSTNILAVLPNAPTVPVPLSASTYNDGTYDHYQLESQSNLYAFNSSTGLNERLLTSSTGSLLKTQACVHTASGQDIFGTVINTVRGLNIYDIGNDNLGSFGNIINVATLTTLTASSGFNINKTYLNKSVLVYEDTQTSATGGIVVQVSQDDITYYTLTTLFPVVSQAGKRATSSILALKPFNYIRILNNSATTYNNVICSLFSS